MYISVSLILLNCYTNTWSSVTCYKYDQILNDLTMTRGNITCSNTTANILYYFSQICVAKIIILVIIVCFPYCPLYRMSRKTRVVFMSERNSYYLPLCWLSYLHFRRQKRIQTTKEITSLTPCWTFKIRKVSSIFHLSK